MAVPVFTVRLLPSGEDQLFSLSLEDRHTFINLSCHPVGYCIVSNDILELTLMLLSVNLACHCPCTVHVISLKAIHMRLRVYVSMQQIVIALAHVS